MPNVSQVLTPQGRLPNLVNNNASTRNNRSNLKSFDLSQPYPNVDFDMIEKFEKRLQSQMEKKRAPPQLQQSLPRMK